MQLSLYSVDAAIPLIYDCSSNNLHRRLDLKPGGDVTMAFKSPYLSIFTK